MRKRVDVEKTDVQEAVTKHNQYLADQMVEIFEDNSVYELSTGEHHLTTEGSFVLGEFFDTVYVNYRQEVFGFFLDKLRKKGINFSVDDMQKEPVH